MPGKLNHLKMKKILFPLLIMLFFACTKTDQETPTNNPPLGWENVVYQPALTSVIATNGQNVLVRGSHPIDAQGNFVYDQILSAVTTKIPSIDFSNHTLIDVTMIGGKATGEWAQLQQELLAFGLADTAVPTAWPPYTVGYVATLLGTNVCSHSGKLCYWPIQGYNPSMPMEQKIGQFFTNNGYNGQPGGYNFDGLVSLLDSLLKDNTSRKIIYYHCTFGHDRTGALTFSWLVKFGGYSKALAIAKVDSIFIPNEHYMGMINDYYTWLFP